MASDSDDNFDPIRTLVEYAPHLNGICRGKCLARPFYEYMSGALVWTDEIDKGKTPVEVVWALRFLWAYRTSLMLGKPNDEFAEYWRLGLTHFPDWVGFRPDRRQATAKLLRIYRRGRASLRNCLRDAEREASSP